MAAKTVKAWIRRVEEKLPAKVRVRVESSPLFAVNRRQIARAVAVGLFCGFAAPVAQIPAALALGTLARANILVAALVTFVTNPITTPFIYAAAYAVGHLLMTSRFGPFAGMEVHPVAELALGIGIITMTVPVLGYYAVLSAWERHARLRWLRRALKRRSRDSAPPPSPESHERPSPPRSAP